MFSATSRAALACVAGGLWGCSNHPLVDDKTWLPTYQIVHKARCEAQASLQSYMRDKHFMQEAPKLADLESQIKDAQADVQENAGIVDGLVKTLNPLNAKIAELEKTVDDAFLDRRGIVQLIDALGPQVRYAEDQLRRIERQLDDLGPVKEPDDKAAQRRELTKQRDAAQAEFSRVNGELDAAEQMKLDNDEIIILNRPKIEPLEKRMRDIAGDHKAAVNTYNSSVMREKRLRDQLKTFNIIRKFKASEIVMFFDFDITENNNATTTGTVKLPVAIGTLTWGWDVGAKKTRDSQRDVKIAATFEEILNVKQCDFADWHDDNFARLYPISGKIGVDELVWQYLLIAEDSRIAAANVMTASAEFRDELTFTTTINGGVKPTVALTTSHGVEINGDGNVSADRRDFHKVIVQILPGNA